MVPPIMGKKMAGQHHAPIKAGKEHASVASDTTTPWRAALASRTALASASASCASQLAGPSLSDTAALVSRSTTWSGAGATALSATDCGPPALSPPWPAARAGGCQQSCIDQLSLSVSVSIELPFFEGNGPARQGLCGLDFRPCLSSEPSSPPTRALATHDNSGAAGLRPPPLFSTINPRLNFHAIRSAVRLPRASQPCSYPQAGTSSDRARCPTASGLSARGHGRAEVATVSPAAATERRESREARTHSSSPLTPTTLAWIPPHHPATCRCHFKPHSPTLSVHTKLLD